MAVKKARGYFDVLLIVVLAGAVYVNSLNNAFTYDDVSTIEENFSLRDMGNLVHLFGPDYFRISKEASYRPVVTLSYFLDYRLWRVKPSGYHLTNVFFHALNGVLLYLVAKSLLKRRGAALAAALLFCLHPIVTEPVNAVSFREDLQMLTFSLLSFLAYEKFSAAKNKGGLAALCSISFLLALLSKESALIVPGLFLLREFCFHPDFAREIRRKDTVYTALFLVLAGYLIVRFALLRSPVETGFVAGPLPLRILTMTTVFFLYLKLLLFPLTLSIEYVSPLATSLFEPKVFFSILALAVIFSATIRLRRRFPGAVFAVWWFFLALLPAANVFPLYNPVAERYLYFPLAGLCLLPALAGAAAFARLRKPGRILLVSSFVLILGLYAGRTFVRNRDWKDPLVLYEKTVAACPNSARFCNNLGMTYSRQGRYVEAIPFLKKALELDPGLRNARLNLGIVYQARGDFDQAIALFKETIGLEPRNVEAHNSLALAYLEKGMADEALPELKKARELDPNNAFIHFNLGGAYEKKKQFDLAAEEYGIAAKLNPDDAEAHYRLAAMCQELKKTDEAVAGYQRALKLDPSLSLAWNNLGALYLEKKSYAEAIEYFRKALALDPGLVVAWNNLARACERQRMNAEAVDAYRQALAQDGENADALFGLASVYYRQGKTKETVYYYRELLALYPDHAVGLNNLGSILAEENASREEGIKLLERARQLKPEDPLIMDSLGWAYYRQGKKDEARALLERAAALAPGNEEIRKHLEEVKKQ